MTEFVSKEELEIELKETDSNKVPAFKGRNYPIEYLEHREFEKLLYFLFQEEISRGDFVDKYDDVLLMKGGSERGRDCILQLNGKNVGVVQCKRYSALVTLPDFCREIIKFCVHAIQDDDLISDVESFRYYFTALNGLNEKALKFYGDFNTKIVADLKLKQWVEEVLEEYETLTFKDFAEVEDRLKEKLTKIKVELLTGHQIDGKLKNAKGILKIFFEVEQVVDRALMEEFGEKFLGFKNNEDLEKLRKRLQDIPEEKKLRFGQFDIYGFDKDFYKNILKKPFFIKQIADVKLELSKLFIDYLKTTIERYNRLFVVGIKEVSPFSKQVVLPYLFNKYALIHNNEEGGFFTSVVGRREDSFIAKYQTIEEHKQHLLDIGKAVLNDDYSTFVGDGELLELKKKIARFIHAEFATVDQMSERFDKDMTILMPVISHIEEKIKSIMPENGTLIIESNSSVKTMDDFAKLLKGLQGMNG